LTVKNLQLHRKNFFKALDTLPGGTYYVGVGGRFRLSKECVMSKMCIELDSKQLGTSNRVIHGWISKLGLNRTDVFELVRQVCESSGAIYDSLSEDVKHSLANDINHFNYVKNIENDFLADNRRLISAVCNTLGIQHVTDEHESMGMLSLRRSLYYYMDGDVSLNSYSFRGIKQEVIKVERQKKLRKNKVWNTTAKLDYNDEEISRKLSYEEEDNEAPETVNEALSVTYRNGDGLELITKLAAAANLNDAEKQLLMSLSKDHATKGGWVDDFLAKTGIKTTKQNVYQRKDALLNKLRQLVTKQGIKLFR